MYTSGWVPAALPAAFGKPWSMWSVCPLIALIAASLYGPPESSKSPPFACAFAVAYATSASRRFLTFSESGCPSIVIIGTFSFHFSRRIASSSSIRSAYL